VKIKRLSIVVLLVAICGAGLLRDAAAQSASEAPGEHPNVGSHSGHGDSAHGAFHRRFDDAERWAKEFDNPERDAWQKPEEILDALRLERTSRVADIGAGTGYFSVRIAKRVPEGRSSPPISNPTWCAISASGRSASV
jgi:hypothetical protein